MVGHIEVFIRRCRRWFSRTKWMIKLLHFTQASGSPSRRGLVMIQIDGLSYHILQKAIQSGHMPFLKRLMKRENYQLHKFFSGVPSNTPSVQGELFYGVKQCVPAFQFRDKETQKVFTMYDAHSASTVEERLQKLGDGLLKDGSSYGNIFAGGAAEAHFCASIGFKGFLKAINLYSWIVIIVLNFDIVLRVILLSAIELMLSFKDFFVGVLKGYEIWDDLIFIPTRVAVSIVMREIISTYAKIDIARGLPVIHVNFFGYDEQSHRRGPHSDFAVWTLRGIDNCIGRIWTAAHDATRAHYDVWIYSDHGQEETVPYSSQNGFKLKKAIHDLCGELEIDSACEVEGLRHSHEGHVPFPRFIGRNKLSSVIKDTKEEILITAVGPVGHVYFVKPIDQNKKEVFAHGLVNRLKIPLVVSVDDEHNIRCWTEKGEMKLPEDVEKILGPGHPYLKEVADDLYNLCAHPDRGDLMIFGWVAGHPAVSFPMERGAHAGLGPRETDGFALLPTDIPAIEKDKPFLRPYNLREAALIYLERLDVKTFYPSHLEGRPPDQLKVMTYNVHSCLGMDGKISPERIARIIARQNPDVIALQELSVGGVKYNHIDQAEMIAQKLRMEFNFHPVINFEEREYGNAILSRYPMRLLKAAQLPARSATRQRVFEPRGALLVEIDFNHQKILVLNTHLSLWWLERKLQIDALLGKDWLGAYPDREKLMIICGDMNSTEQSYVYKKLGAKFQDIQECLKERVRQKTWSGRLQLQCLDHIFIGHGIEVIECGVPSSELEKMSSDHLPVTAHLRIQSPIPNPVNGEQSETVLEPPRKVVPS